VSVSAARIGIDATTWWNERGFGRFTRELVRALVARGAFRYTLFVDRDPDGALPAGVEVVRAHTRRNLGEASAGSGARGLADVWPLSRAVARAKLDLFFFPAVFSYFPVLARVPCVVAFHDTIAERYGSIMFPSRVHRWLWGAKMRLALLQCARVMTVSSASAADLRSVFGIGAERIDVVTEGADARFCPVEDALGARALRDRLGIPADARLLLYVGGLNPHKNLRGLLLALERCVRERPSLHLAAVGPAPSTDFHANADELFARVASSAELRGRVTFTGFLSDDDLVRMYNAAEALILPSLWEGFGLPALEAMACGTPVLASRRGSLPEVVGDAGLLFDPESTEEIARAILSLTADAALRAQLARRARERAAGFSWERGAALAEASFRRALEQSGARDVLREKDGEPCVPS
jgi:alpha-1,3-rhamnosyl/mannosyltransferase